MMHPNEHEFWHHLSSWVREEANSTLLSRLPLLALSGQELIQVFGWANVQSHAQAKESTSAELLLIWTVPASLEVWAA